MQVDTLLYNVTSVLLYCLLWRLSAPMLTYKIRKVRDMVCCKVESLFLYMWLQLLQRRSVWQRHYSRSDLAACTKISLSDARLIKLNQVCVMRSRPLHSGHLVFVKAYVASSTLSNLLSFQSFCLSSHVLNGSIPTFIYSVKPQTDS